MISQQPNVLASNYSSHLSRIIALRTRRQPPTVTTTSLNNTTTTTTTTTSSSPLLAVPTVFRRLDRYSMRSHIVPEQRTLPPYRVTPQSPVVGSNNQNTIDIWAAEVTVRDRTQSNNNTPTAFEASHVYGITSGVIRRQNNSGRQPSTRSTGTSTDTLLRVPLRYDDIINWNSDDDSSETSEFDSETQQQKRRQIKQNRKRMLYYKKEPNKGKGFIKELCFSSDGRIICSPYNFGIRLLTFSDDCCELPFTLDPNNTKPREMHEIKTKECHSDIVVSTKFSPKQPLLVSGCLRGKVVWHHPVL